MDADGGLSLDFLSEFGPGGSVQQLDAVGACNVPVAREEDLDGTALAGVALGFDPQGPMMLSSSGPPFQVVATRLDGRTPAAVDAAKLRGLAPERRTEQSLPGLCPQRQTPPGGMDSSSATQQQQQQQEGQPGGLLQQRNASSAPMAFSGSRTMKDLTRIGDQLMTGLVTTYGACELSSMSPAVNAPRLANAVSGPAASLPTPPAYASGCLEPVLLPRLQPPHVQQQQQSTDAAAALQLEQPQQQPYESGPSTSSGMSLDSAQQPSPYPQGLAAAASGRRSSVGPRTSSSGCSGGRALEEGARHALGDAAAAADPSSGTAADPQDLAALQHPAADGVAILSRLTVTCKGAAAPGEAGVSSSKDGTVDANATCAPTAAGEGAVGAAAATGPVVSATLRRSSSGRGRQARTGASGHATAGCSDQPRGSTDGKLAAIKRIAHRRPPAGALHAADLTQQQQQQLQQAPDPDPVHVQCAAEMLSHLADELQGRWGLSREYLMQMIKRSHDEGGQQGLLQALQQLNQQQLQLQQQQLQLQYGAAAAAADDAAAQAPLRRRVSVSAGGTSPSPPALQLHQAMLLARAQGDHQNSFPPPSALAPPLLPPQTSGLVPGASAGGGLGLKRSSSYQLVAGGSSAAAASAGAATAAVAAVGHETDSFESVLNQAYNCFLLTSDLGLYPAVADGSCGGPGSASALDDLRGGDMPPVAGQEALLSAGALLPPAPGASGNNRGSVTMVDAFEEEAAAQELGRRGYAGTGAGDGSGSGGRPATTGSVLTAAASAALVAAGLRGPQRVSLRNIGLMEAGRAHSDDLMQMGFDYFFDQSDDKILTGLGEMGTETETEVDPFLDYMRGGAQPNPATLLADTLLAGAYLPYPESRQQQQYLAGRDTDRDSRSAAAAAAASAAAAGGSQQQQAAAAGRGGAGGGARDTRAMAVAENDAGRAGMAPRAPPPHPFHRSHLQMQPLPPMAREGLPPPPGGFPYMDSVAHMACGNAHMGPMEFLDDGLPLLGGSRGLGLPPGMDMAGWGGGAGAGGGSRGSSVSGDAGAGGGYQALSSSMSLPHHFPPYAHAHTHSQLLYPSFPHLHPMHLHSGPGLGLPPPPPFFSHLHHAGPPPPQGGQDQFRAMLVAGGAGHMPPQQQQQHVMLGDSASSSPFSRTSLLGRMPSAPSGMRHNNHNNSRSGSGAMSPHGASGDGAGQHDHQPQLVPQDQLLPPSLLLPSLRTHASMPAAAGPAAVDLAFPGMGSAMVSSPGSGGRHRGPRVGSPASGGRPRRATAAATATAAADADAGLAGAPEQPMALLRALAAADSAAAAMRQQPRQPPQGGGSAAEGGANAGSPASAVQRARRAAAAAASGRRGRSDGGAAARRRGAAGRNAGDDEMHRLEEGGLDHVDSHSDDDLDDDEDVTDSEEEEGGGRAAAAGGMGEVTLRKTAISGQRRKLTKAMLQGVYDLPINEAADRLQVGVTVLKKYCRKFDIPRWPFRKLKSMEKLIKSFCEAKEKAQAAHSLAGMEEAQHTLNELMSCRNEIYFNPDKDIDDYIKKLRQANFKQEYKARQGGALNGESTDQAEPEAAVASPRGRARSKAG